MKITVAICTWNRATLLDLTLKSLAHVSIPAGVQWEVIVADNNSTDHTQQILERHQRRLPLSVVFVERQGKSYALNDVTRRLDGDLVLWTDDDVLFDRNWIRAYVQAARRWPDADFFGGFVEPVFLAAEPRWLRPAWPVIHGVYAARELGDKPFPFTEKCLPFGANVAMRVDIQKQYRYDHKLGRRGELMLAGEETQQMLQMLGDGRKGMWVPESRVRHLITPDRMELEHIRRFFYGLGNTRKGKYENCWLPSRFFNGLWHILRASLHETIGRVADEQTQPFRWVKSRARASYAWGRATLHWQGFPNWMKPAAMRGGRAKSSQPRYEGLPAMRRVVESLGLDSAAETAPHRQSQPVSATRKVA